MLGQQINLTHMVMFDWSIINISKLYENLWLAFQMLVWILINMILWIVSDKMINTITVITY